MYDFGQLYIKLDSWGQVVASKLLLRIQNYKYDLYSKNIYRQQKSKILLQVITVLIFGW